MDKLFSWAAGMFAIGLIAFILAIAYKAGSTSVQAKWDKEKAVQQAAIQKRELENEELKRQHAQKLANQKLEYDNEIAAITVERDRLASRSLRIPAPACPGAGQAPAGGTEGGAEAPAGTIALPEEVAGNLRRLMESADSIVASCRVAQDFIKSNGFGESDGN